MKINTKQKAVMQVLPHLNSGGLVSGAVEVAKELVDSNFNSFHFWLIICFRGVFEGLNTIRYPN